jgi:hypothetical protein
VNSTLLCPFPSSSEARSNDRESPEFPDSIK